MVRKRRKPGPAALQCGQPRRLNRVTVAGDIPAGIDGQHSYSVTGDASHYSPVADAHAA